MGGACNRVASIEYTSKYYFNDLDNNLANEIAPIDINLNSIEMEERVSLTIEIKNVDTSNEHWVELIRKTGERALYNESVGFTERKIRGQDNAIIFQQFFTIPYYFEKQQLLDFKVFYNNYQPEIISTSLGSIMGGRGQTLKKNLSNGETIYIKGKEHKKSSKKMIFNIELQGNNFVGMKFRYTIIDKGTEHNQSNKKIYDSEVKGINNKNVYTQNRIIFDKCVIPVMYLNPGGQNTDNIISIEIFDIIHKTSLGKYEGSYNVLKNSQHFEIVLNNNLIGIINCKEENKPTFISYLRSGINIGLTIGIDFTGSNGHYKDPPSLHFLGGGLNNYEQAIRSCGDIVSAYDKEQSFPVFAFGFNFINPSLNNFDGKYTDFNFPINCSTENPSIRFIDGVLREYRNFITKINLAGPTYFSPMINDLILEVNQELDEGKLMNYHIIMILTDGMIDDMAETKDSLVAASFLPISVIIIGIGNGDFRNMNVLDADEYPLYDRTGRKADRDLVQFVPYNQFKNNPQKLAEQVLEEIPRQVVEYYQHKGIQPNDN